jgi:tetratricopeptide (TPR) repeat protein
MVQILPPKRHQLSGQHGEEISDTRQEDSTRPDGLLHVRLSPASWKQGIDLHQMELARQQPQFRKKMKKHYPLLVAALVAQFCLTQSVCAQLVEDIELRKDGTNAIVQIRFITAVQYQRSIAAKSADLVQIFYNILPSAEAPKLVTGERRTAGGNGLPQMVITDEAISRDNPNARKLMVRFSSPTNFKVRAGRSKERLEIVLEGLASSVRNTTPALTVNAKPYFVILQSTTEPGTPLAASIPSQLQDSEVFTARRIADGKTLFDTNLGYFASLNEAERAQKVLLNRFPGAVVMTSTPPAESPAPIATSGIRDTTLPTSAPEVESSASKLLAQANAADDRGDYADAIAALDSLLNLPPNSITRKAQQLIGVTRLKSGDTQRARGEFETFLKLYPAGADSEQVRQYLANLPSATESSKARKTADPVAIVSGSVSMFYYGGQSKVQSQDFLDSPLGGLPVLQSQSDLSATDQKQLQSNLDLNWRYRDAESDMRFVFRDTYSADLLPGRPSKNRLSALYFEKRSFTNGTSFKVGRQSPTGGGALYRFDGLQAGYTFAPKWKVNAVYGVPTDPLLDARRSFYGVSVDADALTTHMSGSVYLNQQMIDSEIDRRGIGTELRYFNEGLALSGQVDYDQVLQGLNITSMQGSWQLPDTTVFNFLLDRRATPIRTLGNILFFQDPTLLTPARNIQDLLATTPIDMLRGQVNGITSFQNQAMVGFTTPVAANWQAGANINYTNVDEIKPVAVILPNGQPSTGNLWSLGLQAIGSNLYSSRDTHVLSASFLNGPTYSGTLLSYNNLTGISEELQIEPSLRYYTQSDNAGNKTNRWTPGLRATYRIAKRVSLESELSYEVSDTQGPLRTESANRLFYYLGGRFDF